MHLARMAQIAVVAWACWACGRPYSASASGTDDRIPECDEYVRLLSQCTGRDAGSQYPSDPDRSDAERDALQRLCRTNLERLKQACR